jgi:signal transduction histidine kinase
VLRAPFTRRAWSELLYVLAALPLGVLGLAYAAATLYAGAFLAITLIGLPLVAAAVQGARLVGTLHRRLLHALLGLRIGDPAPRRRASGIVGWVKTGLLDSTAWRTMAYLVLKGPVAVVTFALGAGFWVQGFVFASYPLWWWLLRPVNVDETGRRRFSGIQFGTYYFDSWPRALLSLGIGVTLLLAAPWVVRGVLTLDRLLAHGLLGPPRMAARVRDLEETRAHAVEDSAASLRRIERDLHDGAQARLVALAMKLGMIKDELDGAEDRDGRPADLAQTRSLVESAHTSAKEALVELRDLARGIHPPVLDRGLDAALATLAASSPVPVRLHVDVAHRPPPPIETIAYFCTAELLTNVAKHSGARRATVDLSLRDETLRLQVGDDGTGGARIGDHAGGLAGLADRVRTVDGSLRVASPPGGPTVVTVELPARAPSVGGTP